MTRLQRRLLVLALASASASPMAMAERTTLEEIVVTARRQVENLQQTPVSVTALSSEMIERAGLGNITDIERATPNLNFTLGQGGGGSTVNAFIRGVGEIDFIITADPAVGTYVDGVYLARVSGANLELLDVERIEVLRGPQGTLFGKNAIGGAINVSTRKPDEEFRFQAETTVGRFKHREARFYVNVPVSDELAFSVAALHRSADGWQRRPGKDAGDIDVTSGRLSVRWTPGERFESLLSIDMVDQDQNGYPNVMLAYRPTPFTAFPLGDYSAECCFPNRNIDRSQAGDELSRDDVKSLGVTWTNRFDFDSWQLTSITAVRDMEAVFGRDGDNSQAVLNGDIHDLDHEQYSQEFQFSGSALDGRLDWLLGLYLFRENSRDETDLIILPGFDISPNYYSEQKTRNEALYLHGNYHLSERLTAIAGVRVTREEKDFTQTMASIDSGLPWAMPELAPGMIVTDPACSNIDPNQTRFRCKEDWQEVSPKLGLQYQGDDWMVYGHWAQGFRSGGFNGRPFASTQDIRAFDPETLDSFEIGAKSEWFDRRLRLNGALFYNRYEDVQVLVVRQGAVSIENASKATIRGFELEATAVPAAGLELIAGIGYIDADSDGWVDDTGDFSDTKLPHTPRWSANLAASYETGLGELGQLRLDANLKYKGSHYLDGVNTPELNPGGHTLLGAAATWTLPGDQWEFSLRGENLTDKRVVNSGFDGTGFFGYVEGFYNPPRRWYLTARYRF